jgi:uncharacterized GH25 family protein
MQAKDESPTPDGATLTRYARFWMSKTMKFKLLKNGKPLADVNVLFDGDGEGMRSGMFDKVANIVVTTDPLEKYELADEQGRKVTIIITRILQQIHFISNLTDWN